MSGGGDGGRAAGGELPEHGTLQHAARCPPTLGLATCCRVGTPSCLKSDFRQARLAQSRGPLGVKQGGSRLVYGCPGSCTIGHGARCEQSVVSVRGGALPLQQQCTAQHNYGAVAQHLHADREAAMAKLL